MEGSSFMGNHKNNISVNLTWRCNKIQASQINEKKAIRLNFSLVMTNDMIAMASSWEERLRPPIYDKKDNPQSHRFGQHLLPPVNSKRETKKT